MGKVPVRLKEVVYQVSPFELSVMDGLWKDLPHKIQDKISRSWLNFLVFAVPVASTMGYAHYYRERTKLDRGAVLKTTKFSEKYILWKIVQ
ncbi:hypothetical protein O6H91_02G042700 [Diphasiastrum complanatum]|uniref:Uncharacterized protein n=1 Tax=Diphasiastrum complanatum TaxID=34168 RepID=A0ACC2EER1_DIPCM|nr:hypothetical protein O6H91_02G042700 [Diphasiastrum complanatum]